MMIMARGEGYTLDIYIERSTSDTRKAADEAGRLDRIKGRVLIG